MWQVKKALLTQQPSELLLKGVVSSEVRSMESDLERKVRCRVLGRRELCMFALIPQCWLHACMSTSQS